MSNDHHVLLAQFVFSNSLDNLVLLTTCSYKESFYAKWFKLCKKVIFKWLSSKFSFFYLYHSLQAWWTLHLINVSNFVSITAQVWLDNYALSTIEWVNDIRMFRTSFLRERILISCAEITCLCQMKNFEKQSKPCRPHHWSFIIIIILLILVSFSIQYKIVVLGGGAGGCAAAAKFADKAGEGGLAVVEPADTHYYQPLWTLVGGGIKRLADSARPMAGVLPRKARWIRDAVARLEPDGNRIVTGEGRTVEYDFLVVALGLTLRWVQFFLQFQNQFK